MCALDTNPTAPCCWDHQWKESTLKSILLAVICLLLSSGCMTMSRVFDTNHHRESFIEKNDTDLFAANAIRNHQIGVGMTLAEVECSLGGATFFQLGDAWVVNKRWIVRVSATTGKIVSLTGYGYR